MKPLRIAMWSGPRNISTAMMRSWEARGDTYVCDEPLYAHFLLVTRRDHPGAHEVIAQHERDWRKVAAWLTGPIPDGKPIFYQKHMAHHLLPDIERDWLSELTHCLLLRDPREMLPSLLKKYPNATRIEDTGLPQQTELFEFFRQRTGRVPPVLDARDVLLDPRGQLKLLCDRLEIEFTDRMLSWPPGLRSTDGVWAKHWYDAVEKSTGFEAYRPKTETVGPEHQALLDECLRHYDRLSAHRLGA